MLEEFPAADDSSFEMLQICSSSTGTALALLCGRSACGVTIDATGARLASLVPSTSTDIVS